MRSGQPAAAAQALLRSRGPFGSCLCSWFLHVSSRESCFFPHSKLEWSFRLGSMVVECLGLVRILSLVGRHLYFLETQALLFFVTLRFQYFFFSFNYCGYIVGVYFYGVHEIF